MDTEEKKQRWNLKPDLLKYRPSVHYLYFIHNSYYCYCCYSADLEQQDKYLNGINKIYNALLSVEM